MEVFIHNLPAQGDLSHRGLTSQLRPFMQKLRIPDDAYHVEKPWKKRHAYITFQNVSDAQQFLERHGQRDPPTGQRGRTQSNLRFLGAEVMCKKSSWPPNPITLRGLAFRDEKNDHAMIGPNLDKPTNERISFLLISAHCGNYAYIAGQLAFMPEVSWTETGLVIFAKRNLIIIIGGDKRIQVPLNTIVELVWSASGRLTLTLNTVPHFIHERYSLDEDQKRTRSTSLGSIHNRVVGICLVYSLQVQTDHIGAKLKELGSRVGLTISRFDVIVRQPTTCQLGYLEFTLRRLKEMMVSVTANSSLPFDVVFQLQALAYNGYLHPAATHDLMKALIANYRSVKGDHSKNISTASIKTLFEALEWPSPHGNPEDFKVSGIMQYLHEVEEGISKGSSIRGSLAYTGSTALVHRVVVTPARMTLHGPEPEAENRVLRKFPNHHEYFLRVRFSDENGQDLRFNANIMLDPIYERFKKILKKGIQIAGRTYTLLGWSHSSLRAHSVWFVAPFFDDVSNFQTHFNIIAGLGNFSSITSPARCAARIGQAFSETPYTVSLDENEITVARIPDVKSWDGKRCFSDGVGKVAWDVVQDIWASIPSNKGSPTCFQIRWAGCKGMIALDRELRGKQIHVRGSMNKFESQENGNLEICDMAAAPIPLMLNRQMIKILEDMGVKDQWFIKHQTEVLDDLRRVTFDTFNAAGFIKRQSIGVSINLHKLIQLAALEGFDYRKEPILRQTMETIVLRELRLVKHKARIPVKTASRFSASWMSMVSLKRTRCM
jgi:hypothetical protein